jgi:hypothetical protein
MTTLWDPTPPSPIEKGPAPPKGDYEKMLNHIAWRLHLAIGGPQLSQEDLETIYSHLDANLAFEPPE